MLSERERIQFTKEIVDAGRKMHTAVQSPKDRAAIAAALGSATAVADLIREDMPTAFTELILTIELRMRCVAAAASSRPLSDGDTTLRDLDDAVQDAHFHLAGLRGGSWQAAYCGGGLRRVWFTLPDRRVIRRVDVQVAELVDRFGPCLVAALFQLAAGANRVLSLLDLLALNIEHVRPKDSLSYDRNYVFVGTSLFGYMMELSRVIDDLHTCGIAKKLSNPGPWRALRAERKRWAHIRDFRNDVAFHLGWPDKTVRAVTDLAKERACMVLLENDGDSGDTVYSGGEDLLLRASGLEQKQFRTLADSSLRTWGPLFDAVEGIFLDLARQCGARV